MRDDHVVGDCLDVGVEGRISTAALAPPTIWHATNAGADAGSMPAKVSVNIRPIVTAGLAKLVDDVKK